MRMKGKEQVSVDSWTAGWTVRATWANQCVGGWREGARFVKTSVRTHTQAQGHAFARCTRWQNERKTWKRGAWKTNRATWWRFHQCQRSKCGSSTSSKNVKKRKRIEQDSAACECKWPQATTIGQQTCQWTKSESKTLPLPLSYCRWIKNVSSTGSCQSNVNYDLAFAIVTRSPKQGPISSPRTNSAWMMANLVKQKVISKLKTSNYTIWNATAQPIQSNWWVTEKNVLPAKCGQNSERNRRLCHSVARPNTKAKVKVNLYPIRLETWSAKRNRKQLWDEVVAMKRSESKCK